MRHAHAPFLLRCDPTCRDWQGFITPGGQKQKKAIRRPQKHEAHDRSLIVVMLKGFMKSRTDWPKAPRQNLPTPRFSARNDSRPSRHPSRRHQGANLARALGIKGAEAQRSSSRSSPKNGGGGWGDRARRPKRKAWCRQGALPEKWAVSGKSSGRTRTANPLDGQSNGRRRGPAPSILILPGRRRKPQAPGRGEGAVLAAYRHGPPEGFHPLRGANHQAIGRQRPIGFLGRAPPGTRPAARGSNPSDPQDQRYALVIDPGRNCSGRQRTGGTRCSPSPWPRPQRRRAREGRIVERLGSMDDPKAVKPDRHSTRMESQRSFPAKALQEAQSAKPVCPRGPHGYFCARFPLVTNRSRRRGAIMTTRSGRRRIPIRAKQKGGPCRHGPPSPMSPHYVTPGSALDRR